MNKYKIRNELKQIAKLTENKINQEIEFSTKKIQIFISEHVADRLIDRSTNVVRDIRNINYIMQQLYENYICNLLYYSDNTHRLLVYSRYKKIVHEIFSLGCTLYVQDNIIKFTVRTFIPDNKISSLDNKVHLEIKTPKKKIFDVNSNFQKFIYSASCPEELKKLR